MWACFCVFRLSGKKKTAFFVFVLGLFCKFLFWQLLNLPLHVVAHTLAYNILGGSTRRECLCLHVSAGVTFRPLVVSCAGDAFAVVWAIACSRRVLFKCWLLRCSRVSIDKCRALEPMFINRTAMPNEFAKKREIYSGIHTHMLVYVSMFVIYWVQCDDCKPKTRQRKLLCCSSLTASTLSVCIQS